MIAIPTTTPPSPSDPLEHTIACLNSQFTSLNSLCHSTSLSLKSLNSATSRLSLSTSQNAHHHLTSAHAYHIKQLEEEVDRLRAERMDYEMLKQEFKRLEEYVRRVEAELDAVREGNRITRRVEYSNQFEKRMKKDIKKLGGAREEFVSVKKCKDISDKVRFFI
jgi:DNA repair ATPase RecN